MSEIAHQMCTEKVHLHENDVYISTEKQSIFFCLFSSLFIARVCDRRAMENRPLSVGINFKQGLWINLKHYPCIRTQAFCTSAILTLFCLVGFFVGWFVDFF